MPEALVDLLDFDLAWTRTRPEILAHGRPGELALIEQDADAWLAELEQSVRSGAYAPSPMEVVELPKALGIVRPLGRLVPEDRVIYTALVGACFPAIFDALAWSQGTRDFAHVLRRKENDPSWVASRFKGWDHFRKASLIDLEEGFSYVAFTDIAAFYENVDFATLISDLNALGAPPQVTKQLAACLSRWARLGGRGLPQGPQASDILSKVYLNNVDRALSDQGILHVRYSDDFRIFAHSRTDAQAYLVELGRLLRKRGLTLQAAKTEIARGDRAEDRIQGIVPILKGLMKRYVADAAETLEVEEPYPELFEIDAALQEDPSKYPIDVIREAFQAYFIDESDGAFDKTLFHFLLNRLGKAKDPLAVPHCQRIFERQPQETTYILSYLEAVDGAAEAESQIAEFLMSAQGKVYPHQALLIMRWAAAETSAELERLVRLARVWAFDSAAAADLRAICRRVIGAKGNFADLERLEDQYSETHDALEQAQIIMALVRMEKQRRNAFLARAETDGELQRRAVALVRARAASTD